MNKIKTFKYKTSSSSGKNDGSGIFNKISKRYSTVNFLRSKPGRKSSPQPISTGSYDMTGNESEDLKREIGAPILISKTTIDSDTSTHCIRSIDSPIEENSKESSENEVFHDTVTNFNEIKFSFLPTDETENRLSTNSEYDSPRPQPPMVLRKNKSKSASNLHKSEIKLFLHKAPSLELDAGVATEHYYDLPTRKLQNQGSSTEKLPRVNEITSNSEMDNKDSTENMSMIYVSKHDLTRRQDKSTSRESFGFNSSCDEDFDLKSASFQSLEARNLFLSIEELNEITRQINESEEFGQDVDHEYCEHRDKLKPDERRITLLRNKNYSKIDLASKREKLSNAWTGLKHWIGEEKVKIKDVVQKHASMQRVGGPSNANGKINIVRNQDFFDKVRNTSVAHGSIQQRMSHSSHTDEISSSSHTKEHQQHGNKQWECDATDIESDELSLNSEKFKHGDVNNVESHSSRTRSRIFGSEDKDNLPAFLQAIVTRKNSKTDDTLEGQNGFEELRRYLKQGGDFGKDLVAILQERVDAEQLYSKSLSKMASKLSKACREIPGSLADAWRGVATEMESRSEVHRQFSNSMVEEIVKPLKVILDNHHKTRKSIESTVDKSARILSEWRTSEAKAKKSSHCAARENEKLQDAMLDVRIQRSPSVALLHHNNHKSPEKEIKNAEKDCAKLDNKRRKAEDLVKRADVEYYTLCIRAERARVEWEMSVLRGSTILQNHENQRLTCLKNYVADYLKFSNVMNPSLNQIVDRLAPLVNACNVQKDLTVVKNIRRSSEGPSEQLLPDFYCEHTTLAMNRERRKHALVKLLQLVRTDLERERKSRNGLKELSNSMNTPENPNIADKLYHIRSMLTYLEGARFKLQSALLELDHKPRGLHPLGPHIQITRDRTGLQQSILKVPLWLKNGDETDRMSQEQFVESDLDMSDGVGGGTAEHCVDSRNETLIKHFDRNFNRSKSNIEFITQPNDVVVVTNNNRERNGSSSPVFDRGIADGGSNQPDSDFDEFSSQDEDEELSKKQTIPRMLNTQQPMVIGRCKALYNYSPKLYDELELNPGDLIDVHAKQEDGWWLGALKNKIGIFPATYVEEIA